MNQYNELYKNNLLYVFTKDQLKDTDKNCMVIVKDNTEKVEDDNALVFHYGEDFEKYLNFRIPTKNRKTKQLISIDECKAIINEIEYGVLSFQKHEFPYSVGINHIYMDGRLFFHCAKSGYKLEGIGCRANLNIIKDLGINKEVGTHNHDSVAIYGTLVSVDDFDTKKAVLLELVRTLAPKHPYDDRMVGGTQVLELKIEYITGKTHVR